MATMGDFLTIVNYALGGIAAWGYSVVLLLLEFPPVVIGFVSVILIGLIYFIIRSLMLVLLLR